MNASPALFQPETRRKFSSEPDLKIRQEAPFVSNHQGLSLVLLSSVLFGSMALMIKALGGRIPIFELAFFRSAIATVPLAWILWKRNDPVGTRHWPVLCLRGLWGLLAMLCYFWAISKIPLASAVLLNYSSPVFTAVFAVAFLKEKFSFRSVLFLSLAILGLFLVVQPSFQGSMNGYLAGLGAGIFSGAAYATVKYLTDRNSPWLIVLYFNVVATLGMLPFVFYGWRTPSLADASWLIGISLAGTCAQILMTLGFQRAPVSRASVATLFILVITTLGGWLFWNETPDILTFLGITTVILAIWGINFNSPEAKS